MKSMGIAVDLSGKLPGMSLLSYWIALELKRAGVESFIMSRGGMAHLPEVAGVPGGDVDRILFIGNPLEAVEFANRYEETGLKVYLLACGVTNRTLPVLSDMLKPLEWVGAFPETAAWLRSCGCNPVVVRMPFPEDTLFEDKLDASGKVLRVLQYGGAPGVLRTPHSTITVDHINWVSAENSPVESRGLVGAVASADVVVRVVEMLDDPVDIIAMLLGVPSVSLEPSNGRWGRIIRAGQMKAEGVFAPVPIKTDDGLDFINMKISGARIADALREMSKSAPQEDARKDVKLGIVIPFGGLPIDTLQSILEGLEFAVGEAPVVVANQGNHDEELFQLCKRLNVEVVDHQSPGGWRLGLARNIGAEALPDDVTHYVFIDGDIDILPGYLEYVEEQIHIRGDIIMVPHVQNENGETRIGSGLAIYPRKSFAKSGGFCVEFKGWGYEDLELIKRLRRDWGIPSAIIGSATSPMLFHRDHEERHIESRDANLRRYNES